MDISPCFETSPHIGLYETLRRHMPGTNSLRSTEGITDCFFFGFADVQSFAAVRIYTWLYYTRNECIKVLLNYISCLTLYSLCGFCVIPHSVALKFPHLPTLVCLCVRCGCHRKQCLFPLSVLKGFSLNGDAVCLLRGTDWIFKYEYVTLCDSTGNFILISSSILVCN